MGLLAELEEVDYLLSAECEKLTEELREKCRARRPEVAQVLKDVKAAVTDGKVVTDTRDKPERLLGSSAMRRLIEEVLDHPEGRRYGACMAAWAADADLKQTAERKKSSMLATLLSLIFEDEITGMIDWRRNYARIGRPE